MALLRSKDIRTMRIEDIRAKMRELDDELMHERGVAAMGGAPASPGKIRALRKNIARIHTIQRELELAEAKKKAERSAPQKKKSKGKAKPEDGKSTKKERARSEEEKK